MRPNQYPRLVLDPEIPAEMARLIRAHPHVPRAIRNGWTPATDRGGLTALARSALLILTVTTALMALLALATTGTLGGEDFAAALGTGLFLSGGFLTVGMFAEVVPRLSQHRMRRALRYLYTQPDRFVLPEDLDQWCRPLLRRAQDAADAVLSSAVNRAGQLDTALNAVRLPEEVWQIARRLAELSKVAADYTKIVGERVPAELAEIYRPYDETLQVSHASLTNRVVALENYAAKVRMADRHYRVHRDFERLREHNPRFEKLRADLVRDDLAQPEIEKLTADVDQVERRFRESIAEARDAAGHLLDPPPPEFPSPPA